MVLTKNCVHCGHKYSRPEFIEHFVQLNGNRVHCSECQEKNYIIGAGENSLFKFLRFLSSLLWFPLAVIAFMIFHSSAETPGVTVISVGHFGFAFLGAMLGVGLSKVIKQILRWHFGHTAIEDLHGDYEI